MNVPESPVPQDEIRSNLTHLVDIGLRKMEDITLGRRALDTKVSFLIAGYSAVLVALVAQAIKVTGSFPKVTFMISAASAVAGLLLCLGVLFHRRFGKLPDLRHFAEVYVGRHEVDLLAQLVSLLDQNCEYNAKKLKTRVWVFNVALIVLAFTLLLTVSLMYDLIVK